MSARKKNSDLLNSDPEHGLVLAIAENLPSVLINGDRYLDTRSLAWVALAEQCLSESVRNKLNQYCGPKGLTDFIMGELHRQLRARYPYDAERKALPATSYPEFSNPLAIAKRLVEGIKMIPVTYRLTVGLPLTFSKAFISHGLSLQLSDRAALLCPSELPKPLPMLTGNPIYDSILFQSFGSTKVEANINLNRVYFSVLVDGYGRGPGTSILARQLGDDLRALLGAARALGICNWDWPVSDDMASHVTIHRELEGKRTIVATEAVEDDIWSDDFGIGTSAWADKVIASGGRENLVTSADRLSKIFRDDITMRRVYTACIWYNRANNSSRPLDSLLEATIAIEVMLGERGEAEGLGLTKLLQNRCAYMLGKNQLEREEIAKGFGDAYKLRSSIVHAGRHRVAESERKIVNYAITLCGRLIAHEIAGS